MFLRSIGPKVKGQSHINRQFPSNGVDVYKNKKTRVDGEASVTDVRMSINYVLFELSRRVHTSVNYVLFDHDYVY